MGCCQVCHHNYLNGLLYHICRIIANIKMLSSVYALNYDLLMSAAILHDIGKLRELQMDNLGNAEYTIEGNLWTFISWCCYDQRSSGMWN